jgi:hypothetical protein
MGNEQQAGQYDQYRAEGRSYSAPRTLIGGGQGAANGDWDENELRRQKSGLTGYKFLTDETGRYNVGGAEGTTVIGGGAAGGGASYTGGAWSTNTGLANNVAMAKGQAQVIGNSGSQGGFVSSSAGNFAQANGSAQVIGGGQVGGGSRYQSSFGTGGGSNYAQASGNAAVLGGHQSGALAGGNYQSSSANYSSSRQIGGGAGAGAGGVTYQTTTTVIQNDGHAQASGNARVLNDGGAIFQSSTRRVEGGNLGFNNTGITTMNKKIFDGGHSETWVAQGGQGGYSNQVTTGSGRMIDGRASYQGGYGGANYGQTSTKKVTFESGAGGANGYTQTSAHRVDQVGYGGSSAHRLSDEELGDYRPYVSKSIGGQIVATSNVPKARGQAAVLDPGFQASTRSIFGDPAPKTINTGMYTSHRRSLSSDRRIQGGSQSAIYTGSGAAMQKAVAFDGNVPKAQGKAAVLVDDHYGGRTSETFARNNVITTNSYQTSNVPVIDKYEVKRDLEQVKNKVKSAFRTSNQELGSSNDIQYNNAVTSSYNNVGGYQTNQAVSSRNNLAASQGLNQSSLSQSNFYEGAIKTSKGARVQNQMRVSEEQLVEPAITRATDINIQNKGTSSIYLKDQSSRQMTEFVPRQVAHVQQARVVEETGQFGGQSTQQANQLQLGGQPGKIKQIETHTVTQAIDGNTSYSEIRQNVRYEDGTEREYQKVTEVRGNTGHLGSTAGHMIAAQHPQSLVQQTNVQNVAYESRQSGFGANDFQTSQFASNMQTSQVRPPSRNYIPINSSGINDQNYASAIKMERFRAREGISADHLRANSGRVNLPAGETGLGINLRDVKASGLGNLQGGQYGANARMDGYNSNFDGSYGGNAQLSSGNFNVTGASARNYGVNLNSLNTDIQGSGANFDGRLNGPNVNFDRGNLDLAAQKNSLEFTLGSHNPKIGQVRAGVDGRYDGNFNAPNADFNIGRAGYDVSGAQANLSMPKVNADFNAPRLNTDINMANANYNMSGVNANYNLPNANINAPSVNVKGPEVDAGFGSKLKSGVAGVGAGIGAGFGALGAKMGLGKSDVNANISGPNIEAPRIQGDLRTPNLDANLNAPKVNADWNAPNMNANLGNYKSDWNTPNMKASFPDVNARLGDYRSDVNAGIGNLKADINAPKLNTDWNAPKLNTDFNAPKLNTDWNAPKIHANMPDVNANLGNFKSDLNANVGNLRGDVNAPKLNTDWNAPKINTDFNAPKLNADWNAPKVDYNLPNANINAPSVNVKGPEVDAGFGSKLKSGVAGVGAGIGAGFGALGAKMGFGKSDVDAKITTPNLDANLNAPKVNADWNAPKLNTDWNTPKLNANMPDVNANLGNFRSDVNAGFGNLKGDINAGIGNLKSDINAPKLNTDWNAPKINTDFNAPKLNTDWNAPKINANMPDVNANLGNFKSDLNANVGNLRADVNAPKLNTDWNTPNMKASFPDVNANLGNFKSDVNAGFGNFKGDINAGLGNLNTNINAPKVSSDWNPPKFGADWNAPKVNAQLPNANLGNYRSDLNANFNKNIDLDVNSPNYKLTAPEANYHLDLEAMNADLKAPNARIGALRSGANIGLEAPNVHGSGININAPSYDANSRFPDMNMDFQNNNRGSLKIGEIRTGSNINQAFGTFDANAPNVSLKTGNADLAARTYDTKLAGGDVKIAANQSQVKLNTEGLNANYNVDLSMQKKNTNEFIANMLPPTYSTETTLKAPTSNLRVGHIQGEVRPNAGFNDGFGISGAGAGLNANAGQYGASGSFGGLKNGMEIGSNYNINTGAQGQGPSMNLGGQRAGYEVQTSYGVTNSGVSSGQANLEFNANQANKNLAYGEYKVGSGSAQKITGAATSGHYLEKVNMTGAHKDTQSTGGFFDTLKEKIFGSSKNVATNNIDQTREVFRQGQGKLVVPGEYTYEGNFVNNKFHGRGNIKYHDGSVFIGEFKNNMREGPGKLYDPIGNLVREGLWVNDQPIN